MDFTQLRYFVAAAECGSISRAARRCGVAQPSLSQQLRRLEQRLDVTLFDRLGRGVALTEAGRALLPRAKRILDEVRDAASDLRQGAWEQTPRLSVGAIPTIAPYVLPSLVAALRGEYPDGEFTIREDLTENLVEALIGNEIDVAIVSTPVAHELIDVDVVGTERMLVVVPEGHPLDHAGAVGVSDLRDEAAVTLHEMHCLGRQINAFCTKNRINRPVVCRTTQLSTVLELVRRRVGVSIVPEMAARRDTGRSLSFVPMKHGTPGRDVALAWRNGRTRPALAGRVRALLAEQVAAR